VTLRKKVLIPVAAMFAGLMVLLYGAAHSILLDGYLELEQEKTREDVNRAVSTLTDKLCELNRGVGDWAAWDDTCAFMAGDDPGYVKRNLIEDTFIILRLNFMFFIDPAGRTVFARAFDLEAEEWRPIPPAFWEHLGPGSPLLNHPDPESSVQGIILLPEGPLLVAAQPILTSEREGPIRGTLIWGRYLDAVAVERLSALTHLSLSVHRLDDAQLPSDLELVRAALSKDTEVLVRSLDADSVAGYTLLEDIYGRPVLVLEVLRPRSIYQQGLASIGFFIWSFLSVSLVVSAGILLFLEKAVLSRLARLSAGVGSIGASGDLSTRLHLPGSDELASLANTINGMVATLEHSRNELRQNEEHYRNLALQLQTAHRQLLDIIEFLPDATFVIDRDHKVIAWNCAMEELTGVAKEDILGRGGFAYAPPFYGRPRPMLIDFVGTKDPEIGRWYKHYEIKGDTVYAEDYAPLAYGGRGAFLWAKASVLFDSRGDRVGAIESIRDITDRKQMEERLKYLSLHDSLTGLYNRAYFEQEMRRLETGRRVPVGLIVCDVDGLKLVNDSLGHTTGDALLVAAAGVLKESFRAEDVVARVGGDEFAVLLPGCDGAAVEASCRRIREAVARYNRENPDLPLSVSTGAAVSSEGPINMDDLFREADSAMYREKLHHSQSARSTIVQILMKVLEARDYITEGHSDRLEKLVVRMARALDLPERSIADLRLLARFHDIGKVGIPDRILFKEGPLSPEEKREMQRHAKLGHRIALSAPNLAPIADLILKHQEWWNGEGYPLGLKGEEIPLECRILAIADAYDVMTNDRPYRKALTPAQAKAELKRYAGTQFDPRLVEMFLQILEPE
jgi:diguanylate cyclase (GGDEF)-like protein